MSLGGSHKIAFKYANQQGYDGLIVFHGDNRGSLKDFKELVETEELLKWDVVMGARFHRYSKRHGISFVRTAGNYAFNLIYTICVQRSVFDMGSGLNYFGRRVFESPIIWRMPDGLTFNNALLLACYKLQLTIHYSPISWHEDGQISNARLVKQGLAILRLLIDYLLRRDVDHAAGTALSKYKSNLVFSNFTKQASKI